MFATQFGCVCQPKVQKFTENTPVMPPSAVGSVFQVMLLGSLSMAPMSQSNELNKFQTLIADSLGSFILGISWVSSHKHWQVRSFQSASVPSDHER